MRPPGKTLEDFIIAQFTKNFQDELAKLDQPTDPMSITASIKHYIIDIKEGQRFIELKLPTDAEIVSYKFSSSRIDVFAKVFDLQPGQILPGEWLRLGGGDRVRKWQIVKPEEQFNPAGLVYDAAFFDNGTPVFFLFGLKNEQAIR